MYMTIRVFLGTILFLIMSCMYAIIWVGDR